MFPPFFGHIIPTSSHSVADIMIVANYHIRKINECIRRVRRMKTFLTDIGEVSLVRTLLSISHFHFQCKQDYLNFRFPAKGFFQTRWIPEALINPNREHFPGRTCVPLTNGHPSLLISTMRSILQCKNKVYLSRCALLGLSVLGLNRCGMRKIFVLVPPKNYTQR